MVLILYWTSADNHKGMKWAVFPIRTLVFSLHFFFFSPNNDPGELTHLFCASGSLLTSPHFADPDKLYGTEPPLQ